MSTLNVDNINEYTTDGKVNVGHDIKLASGKSVLNSDSKNITSQVHIGTHSVSGSQLQLDNVFSADFDHYMLLLQVDTGNTCNIRFRSGGSPDTSNAYISQLHYVYAGASSSTGVDRSNNTSSGRFSWSSSGSNHSTGTVAYIHNPFTSGQRTTYNCIGYTYWYNGGAYTLRHDISGVCHNTTSFDGFEFTPTSATLEVQIYGMVK